MMRLSYENIDRLRTALSQHGCDDDEINYGVEAVISEDPPHPKTDQDSDVLAFALDAIRNKKPSPEDDEDDTQGSTWW